MKFKSPRILRVYSSIEYESFSTASHLLTITTHDFHCSRMKPAMCASCDVMPVVASINSRATSARSMALNERRTLNCSTPGSIFPRRRMPAVSISVTSRPFTSIFVSVASRVVPGIGLTMARSSPTSLFNRLDLPAFGLPTSAILMLSSSSSSACSGNDCHQHIQQVAGACPVHG